MHDPSTQPVPLVAVAKSDAPEAIAAELGAPITPTAILPHELDTLTRYERELEDAQLARDAAIVQVRTIERDYKRHLEALHATYGVPMGAIRRDGAIVRS